MGFNLGGLAAAFRGQQEYDAAMQAKKVRDMQLQQMQMQNDPKVAEMAWNTQMNGMPSPVPPMPGQASVPNMPPSMPQGAPPMPQGGPPQGGGMPQQGGQAAPPQAPPIQPYKPLNKAGPPQDMAGPAPQAASPMAPPMADAAKPPGMQPGEQGNPVPSGPPVELRHNMTLQDAQRFIQQNYGSATAQQKFAALEKVHGYLSADAKIEFQEKTLEQKTKIAEAQIKIKEMMATTDAEYKKHKSELDEAHAETEKYKRIVMQADALHKNAKAAAEPIKAGAAAKNADAHMIAAEASKERAAIAKAKMASGEKLDADDLKAMAKQYNAGDKSVFQNLGRGQQGAENVVRLRKAIRADMEASGKTPEDIAIKLAEFEGLKAGERALGTRTATIGMAGNAAANLAEQVLETSANYKRFPWKSVNDIQIAMDDKTQSKELRAHAGAVNSYINAYARAINPQGAATVSDKEHAREILAKGFSDGDTKAAIAQLQKEIAAEKKAPGQTKQELRDLVKGENNTSNKPVSLPSGWTVQEH